MLGMEIKMTTIKTIWGLQGRISRGEFWLRTLLILCAVFALQALLSGAGTTVLAILSMLALAALVSQCVKRLHDLGFSAVWLITFLLPVLGVLWLIWQLACKAGQASDNAWGLERRGIQKDFLVVRS
jgi:uncharacterized membrane protein YhaH (DUF805 family)